MARTRRSLLLAGTALCAVVAAAVPALALPQNPVVVAGAVKIIDKANTVVVVEKSKTAVIDWSSFNLAAGEKVVFVQGSSLDTIVNQMLGAGASQILGQISAKGTIILTNPNGILFGEGSKVKVGAVVATTAQMSPAAIAALMKGGPASFDIASSSPTASVVNRGTITAAAAGLVGLVAPGVENDGLIQARLGTVQLAAGNTFTVDLYGDKLIKLAPGDQVLAQVTAADGTPLKALVDNSGTIAADGGSITLSANAAKTILAGVINMDGIAQARSVDSRNGEIVLDGGASGTVQVAGMLDASGAGAGQSGGSVTVKGDVVSLASTAIADASGAAGGGTIAIGTAQASSTTLAAGSQLNASATQSGNGGQVETSGQALSIGGARVTTAAANGKGGTWLLDPTDLTVDAAAAASIDSALASGGVTLQTAASGSSGFGTANASGNGDIVISSAIAWNANTTLTLDAYHSVLVNANITATSSGAGLTVKVNDGGSGGNLLTGAGASVTLPGTAALTINGQRYTLITSATALQNMGAFGYYALAGNIDASGIANFTPNGLNSSSQFNGVFNGLGHTVSNLIISNPTAGNLGLFNTIGPGGTVSNIGLVGGSITASNNVSNIGMLAGQNMGTITNDYATGAVSGGSGASAIGGLVGKNVFGTISSSYATGAVSGGSGAFDIGGLVGQNAFGTISSSYATGAVSGSGSGAFGVGGLAGQNSAGTISSSYAAGAVSGSGGASAIGGLVGSNMSTVLSSYATGAVSGSGGASAIGGLVGSNMSTVLSSYATGAVSGSGGASAIGGLVGANVGGSVTASFWDADTTGQSSGYGLNNQGSWTNNAAVRSSTGSTAYAQSTYTAAGWTFATTPTNGTWYMIDGYTRPILASEYGTTITNAHQLELVNLNLSANYVLANNISMAELSQASGVWNTSTGFVPIGFSSALGVDALGASVANASPTAFTGIFDGLGHTISNLTISNPAASNLGLFSFAGRIVQNLGLVGGGIVGGSASAGGLNAGMLAGMNTGEIINDYATGTVSSGYNTGGLVGLNAGGTISSSYATGNVSGSSLYTGGLVGSNADGMVSSNYATGVVSGAGGVGGLVGYSYGGGMILSSYATGAVNGGALNTGGLVGWIFGGTVSSSFASGTVSGVQAVGGLVGTNTSNVYYSYASGTVNGASQVGGLVGLNDGTVLCSYATGAVNGTSGSGNISGPAYIGGLVGFNASGLVGTGANAGMIDSSYASGVVTGGAGAQFVGGLVGYNGNGWVQNSYWDTTTTGMSVGNGSNSGNFGATGLTDAQMKNPAEFPPNVDFGWDFRNTWYQAAGTLPILFASPYVLKVTDDQAMTFGGAVTLVPTYSNFWGSDTASIVNGLSLSTSATSLSDVGGYSIAVSGGTATSGTGHTYTVITVPGMLAILPAPLTITIASASKTYGATVNLASSFTTSGLVNGDSVSGVTEMSRGTAATASVGSYPIFADSAVGSGLLNYYISYVPGTLTVTPAPLTITAASVNKTYGGTAGMAFPIFGLPFSTSGLVNGDNVRGVADSSAGAAATAGVGSYSLVVGGAIGSGLSNYTITYVPGALTVTPAPLVVTANSASVSQGAAFPALTVSYSGWVNGDGVSSLLVAPTVSVATNSTASAGSYTLVPGGAVSVNYAVTYVGGVLTISDAGQATVIANTQVLAAISQIAPSRPTAVATLATGGSVGPAAPPLFTVAPELGGTATAPTDDAKKPQP